MTRLERLAIKMGHAFDEFKESMEMLYESAEEDDDYKISDPDDLRDLIFEEYMDLITSVCNAFRESERFVDQHK